MIKLLKNKILLVEEGKRNKKVNNIIFYLNELIEIDENYTLKDFFKIVKKNKDIFNIIFYSDLGGNNLQLYIDDINKKVKKKKKEENEDNEKIDYLGIFWMAEHWKYKDKTTSVEIDPEFYGVGTRNGMKTNYSIDLCPLNTLKNCKIKLNKEFKLCSYIAEKKIIEPVLLVDSSRYFTVYDFLRIILYEVSWNGSPNNRDERLNDIIKEKRKIDKLIKKGDFSKFKKLKDFKKKLKED
jgi:hypothetical protein